MERIRQEVNRFSHDDTDTSICKNGNILFFLLKGARRNPKTRKTSVAYLDIAKTILMEYSLDVSLVDTKLVYRLRAVYAHYLSLTKGGEKRFAEMQLFLRQAFPLPSPQPSSAASTPNELALNSSNPQNVTPINSPDKVFEFEAQTPVKTRNDCKKCTTAKKLFGSIRKKFKKKRIDVLSTKKQLTGCNKVQKQKIKRKELKISDLKQMLKNVNIKNSNLERRLRNSQIEKANLISEKLEVLAKNEKLTEQNQALQSELKSVKKKLQETTSYSNYLESLSEREQEGQQILISKSGKFYSDDIRRCIYYQLICDVPIQRCGFLLIKIMEILGGEIIKSAPCATTCAQMAYELGVLATIHVMEFMLTQKALCLSWDATTVDGKHVNEIHLTANKVNCLIFDVQHLPGGKTGDYVNHIMGTLTDAAATFASYKGLIENEVLTSLKSAIGATLSDRAAVNGAVTRQLCEELDSELLQLNCNVHPLDSVARKVKTDLVIFDTRHEIHGRCYGSEGSAANLIKAISTLRFKDGTGDPMGFKNFLRENNIPVGAFPRYVGNRLHVLFHLAGVVLLHEEKLCKFIEKQCTAATKFRSSLLHDLQDQKTMIQIWALAVLGKTFSGPWMTKFYSSKLSNLEMGSLIQASIKEMESWLADISVLLEPQKNVFQESLDASNDEVFSAILTYPAPGAELQMEAMSTVINSTLHVLRRQLSDFLDGGKFHNPTPTMMLKAAPAPTHNMASERALGSLDRLWRRAPNATMGFLNGKLKAKLNKTLQWLDNKSEEERKNLIRFVKSQASTEKAKCFIEKKKLQKEIAKRRTEVASQRQLSKKRSLVKNLNKVLADKKDLSEMDLTQDQNVFLKRYIDCPDSVLGTLILHSVDEKEKYGRFLKIKKNHKFVLSFWGLEDSESTSDDFTLPASSLFADLIMGHVIFM